MHRDHHAQSSMNQTDELISGLRPGIDERLVSDILGASSGAGAPEATSSPATPAQTPPVFPSHQAISARAYEIYIRTGSLSGTSVQNWLFAKNELEHSARSGVGNSVAAEPVSAFKEARQHGSAQDAPVEQPTRAGCAAEKSDRQRNRHGEASRASS